MASKKVLVKKPRKYTLLQDVLFVSDGKYNKTFIVSTMSHLQEQMYLIAGFGKPIQEKFLKPIKTKQTT